MKPLGTHLLAERSDLPRWTIFPLGLLLILGLGAVDYAAPGRMTFTLLYLMVCMIAGWAAGATAAVTLALFAGLVIGWVEWQSTITDPMPVILAWNTFCRVSIFAGVAWLAAEATRLTRQLHQAVQERTEQLEQEISQHKYSVAALQQAEDRYRSLLSNIPAIVWVRDPDFHTYFISDKIREIAGFEPGDIYAAPENFWVGRAHPEDAPQVKAQCGALLEGRAFDVEYRFQCKDGRWIWLNDRSSTTFTRNGRTYAYGVCMDVTARKEAEDALHRSEQQNRDMLATVLDGFLLLDAQGCLRDVNAVYCQMTGFAREELLGRHITELDPVVTRQEIDNRLAELVTAGRARFESRHRCKSGVEIDVEINLSSPPSANGCYYCFVRDISGRKRHELVLRIQRDVAASLSLTSDLAAGLTSLLDLAVTVEGIDSGGIYLVDPETGFLQLCMHRGLSSEFVDAVKSLAPESPQGQLVATGQPIYLDSSTLSQGSLPLPLTEGIRALAAIPLRYENQVLGCLNLASHQQETIADQSRSLLELLGAQAAGAIARIRTEQALKKSEARVRTIVTGAPVVLFAVDKSGNISLHEGQALKSIGWTPGQMVGRNIFEIFQHNPGVLACVQRALQGEEFSAIEQVAGATFETWYSPTRDATGAVSGYIGVATNITERHRLERQILEISDREQARIGQEIHDGLCQQLVSLAFDANALVGQLGRKHRPESTAVQRLAKHLDESITETRRLSRGLFPIRLAGDGLAPAVEELLRNTAERFGLACQFNVPPLHIPDSTVATNLYRIAQETLNNIVKHSRARNVLLDLKETDSHIELRVEDDGIGMPFSGNEPGSGMGLHIMDYRARILGGSLQFHPRPGGGTIISCLVPRTGLR